MMPETENITYEERLEAPILEKKEKEETQLIKVYKLMNDQREKDRKDLRTIKGKFDILEDKRT